MCTACVKFAGVDPAYAHDLGKTMMPPVHWVRDAAWRLYNICVSIKEVGDKALRMGLYDLAFAKYEDAQMVHKTGIHNNEWIGDVEDEGFHKACDSLLTICQTNILLTTLKTLTDPTENVTPSEAADFILKSSRPHAIEDPRRPTPLSMPERSRLYHYRGIALAMKDKDRMAFSNLRIAYQLDPTDQGIKRDLTITRRRLAATTPQEKTAAGTIQSIRLPNEPLELEPPTFTKSEFINGERYLLRRQGYQGM